MSKLILIPQILREIPHYVIFKIYSLFLDMASANGHTDIVKLLLKHGANPNIVNKSKNTPLRTINRVIIFRLGGIKW